MLESASPTRPVGLAEQLELRDAGAFVSKPAGGAAVRLPLMLEVGLVALIVGLALAIRLTPLQRGLGFDELFTAVNFVGADSAWKTATTSINFNNHVGYSLLARLCVELLGRSEWALRLPALLLGLGTLPALWWVSRPVVGPGIALAATLGLALAPEHVRWSTTARGYTALMLGVILTSAIFVIAVNLAVDIVYAWLDPRIGAGEAS